MKEENQSADKTTNIDIHYVLVIHGTFNAPEPGECKWYQPGSSDPNNFCRQLEAELSKLGVSDAVWRSFDSNDAFHWSGANDHQERLIAAEKLANTIDEIIKKDKSAKIHIVAHSHGGNVLLKAIDLYEKNKIANAKKFLDELSKATIKDNRLSDFLNEMPPNIRCFLPVPFDSKLHDNTHAFLKNFLKDAGSYRFIRENILLKNSQRVLLSEISNFLDCIHKDGILKEHIGHIVFLGTPFLRKQWIESTNKLKKIISNMLMLLPGIIACGLVFYVCALFYAAIAWVIPIVPFIGLNLLQWPIGVKIFWLVIFIGFVLSSLRGSPKYNTNIYFDELKKRIWPNLTPTLVVSAKHLDEALIALSSDSIIESQIVPKIVELIHPERNWPIHHRFLGLRDKNPDNFIARLFLANEETIAHGQKPKKNNTEVIGINHMLIDFEAIFLAPFLKPLKRGTQFVLYLFVPLWVRIEIHFVRSFLVTIIMEILNTLVYGLPAIEMQGARIDISRKLRLPKIFDEKNYDIFPDAPNNSIKNSSTKPENTNRYKHLLNDERLGELMTKEDQKAELEFTAWKRIKDQIPGLFERYKSSFFYDGDKKQPSQAIPIQEYQNKQDYEKEIARVWFTLVERFREASGAVELNHSLYYSNPEVIRAVARFIVTGTHNEVTSSEKLT